MEIDRIRHIQNPRQGCTSPEYGRLDGRWGTWQILIQCSWCQQMCFRNVLLWLRHRLLAISSSQTAHISFEFGILGTQTTIFGQQLMNSVLHLFSLFFLAITGILSGFTILHFTSVQLLFLTQMIQTFTTARLFTLWSIIIKEICVDYVILDVLWSFVLNIKMNK